MASASMDDNIPMTLGMRVDYCMSQVDNLSSTQLYALIVAATVGLCFVLLGSGLPNPKDDDVPFDHAKQQQPKKKVSSKASSGLPQPRWHIFRWVNYGFIAAFLFSVCYFILHSSRYLHQDSHAVLLQFLLGWSVFLCYFFGFFGISFVHDITEEEDVDNAK
jgi:4-amino-4-deoxy-L-arabinose transferase-like glycosyltransferase